MLPAVPEPSWFDAASWFDEPSWFIAAALLGILLNLMKESCFKGAI